jgi:VIT1/CCC1 family predicted Fe2+/Mn2+ transporter
LISTICQPTALAQVQKEGWESYLDAQNRGIAITDIHAVNDEIEKIKIRIVRLLSLNLSVGSAGILFALVVIAFYADTPAPEAPVVVSLITVVSQLATFIYLSSSSVIHIGHWTKKAP